MFFLSNTQKQYRGKQSQILNQLKDDQDQKNPL
jgi:hypothetical protein